MNMLTIVTVAGLLAWKASDWQEKRMKLARLLALTALPVLIATGCAGPGGGASAGDDLKTVTVANQTQQSYAPMYIAERLNLFQDAGNRSRRST